MHSLTFQHHIHMYNSQLFKDRDKDKVTVLIIYLFIYLFRACSCNQTSSHTISAFTIQHMAEKGTGEANSSSESRPYFPQNTSIHSFIL